MRGIIRLAVLLVAVAVVPLSAAPPKPPVKKEVTEPEARKLLLAKPYFEGKISKVDVEGDEKTLTVKAVWQVKTRNPEGVRKVNELARRYQDAVRRRNAEEAKKIYEEGVEATLAMYDVEETPVEFLLKCVKDVKVRRAELPEKEAGPDGKPAKYTTKELAALKGDPKLPGYPAELKDLDLDTNVQIYLVKEKKTTDTPKDKSTTADKDKTDKDKAAEKEKPKEAEADDAPVYPVAIIVIIPEPKMGGAVGNPFSR